MACTRRECFWGSEVDVSLLNDVLHTVRSAKGPLTVDDIAYVVEADPSAVAGMLGLLAQKGRLRVDDARACEASACAGCGYGGPEGCPFVMKTPTRFELPSHEIPSQRAIVPLRTVTAEE